MNTLPEQTDEVGVDSGRTKPELSSKPIDEQVKECIEALPAKGNRRKIKDLFVTDDEIANLDAA